MITCNHCNKENPDDFTYCRYCGNLLEYSKTAIKKSFWKKLPSWAWILILAGGIIGMIAIIILFFVAISTIEGVASIMLLAIALVTFGIIPLRKPIITNNFFKGLSIGFFALMGATIDQPGNYIYNKPVEICCCENGSKLNRSESTSHPLPGSTYIIQDYTCYNDAGEAVNTINMFKVLGIRFIEYILLGYLLVGLRKFLWRMKMS